MLVQCETEMAEPSSFSFSSENYNVIHVEPIR